MESKAITGFLAAAVPLADGPEAAAAILAAVSILDGTTFRTADTAALAAWAAERFDKLMPAASSGETHCSVAEPLLTCVELSLATTGATPLRPDLLARLDALSETQTSGMWLWSLAYGIFAADRFKALALVSRLPRRPLWRGFALLRLHQLTGDTCWAIKANRVVARAPHTRLPEVDTALLMAELMAPERAILPPFLLPSELSFSRRRAIVA